MLVRMLYASRSVGPITAEGVEGILRTARIHNPAVGITGLLCAFEITYIQVLEGGRDDVCALYNRIVTDNRHRQVRLLAFEEVRERAFGNWTMGHVNLATIEPALKLRYYKRATLDPFTTSGAATMSFVRDLVATDAVAALVA